MDGPTGPKHDERGDDGDGEVVPQPRPLVRYVGDGESETPLAF